ncbi:MAG TPA: hypothetical protein PKZ84_02570 [Anaerolineae bacterium]|nr:hypothetical protein [Anaerolineae bacterium]HQI86001.1 hypothetical protein [Anaerolineae bacterium]
MGTSELLRKVVQSEDWLALIIGLALALLTGIGVIGNIPWPVFGWLK